MKTYTVIFALILGTIQGYSQEVNSYSLQQAQEYAVQNSYNSKTAQMDVEKARRRVKEITAVGLPQVDGNLSYQNYLKLPVTVIPADFVGGPAGSFETVSFGTEHSMTADITANQLIFDGSYIVGLRAAKTYVELSRNNQVKSEIDIRNQVAQAYYMVLAAEENAEILVENATRVEQIYNETKALYESGFVEEQDADQLKLNKMNIENSIANAKRQVVIARNLLKFQMGIPIADSLSLSDNIETLVASSNQPAFLMQEFDLNRHIEYKIMETRIRAGELTLRNEKAAYLPKLSGFFTHQQQAPSNEFNYLSDAVWYPSTFWGINLRVPIFSSFMRHNKVQQAKIDLDIAKVQQTQVEESLRMEVENARSNYAYALDSYETAKENLALAESIKNKTTIKYKEGLASSLELAQTETQYLTAQGNFIQSLLNLLNGKSQLDKALNNY